MVHDSSKRAQSWQGKGQKQDTKFIAAAPGGGRCKGGEGGKQKWAKKGASGHLKGHLGKIAGCLGKIEVHLGKIEGSLGKIEGHMGKIEGDLGKIRGYLGNIIRHLGKLEGI